MHKRLEDSNRVCGDGAMSAAFPAGGTPAPQTRRRFLRNSAALLAGGVAIPYVFTADAEQTNRPRSKNDRFRIGAIGMRYQGTVITKKATEYGDVVAIADVDREIGEKAVAEFGGKARLYEDYRKLLDRKDVDVLMIAAPDHWHSKMLIDACRAGKDVYLEKPLTLTVDEGKMLCRVVPPTRRIVQVGTWQRSDWRFRLACEMVRAGRVGKLHTVTVTSGRTRQADHSRPCPPRPISIGICGRARPRTFPISKSAAITRSAGGSSIPAGNSPIGAPDIVEHRPLGHGRGSLRPVGNRWPRRHSSQPAELL